MPRASRDIWSRSSRRSRSGIRVRRRSSRRRLLCYIDNQYNIVRTAELLGVHVNTVRQRLDTLREITGGWDDPIAALELHVALRLDAIAAAP